MIARRLIIFRHHSALGNAAAHRLFQRVSVLRRFDGEDIGLDGRHARDLPPARAYGDYRVNLDTARLPNGIEIIDRI